MRLAYADPPYPGRAHLYADHPDYAGEVAYHELVARLEGYDGWALSTSAEALPASGLRDWIQVEPDMYQWREKPDGYVLGQKPDAFCMWMFAWLGAEPDDSLDDVFPGSGNVARAWERWQANPSLPLGRSAAAEGRAARRAEARALASHPMLEDAA